MTARPSRQESVNEYEQKRLDRIAENQTKLGSIGVLQHKSLLEASLRSVKRPATPRPAKGTTPATRHSQRLQKAEAEYTGLQEFPDEGKATASKPDVAGESTSGLYSTETRCRQKGRGSLYDNVAGITCHFCRQKKLCGEEECQRCSKRDVEQDCTGKSECSRCQSACGRFCRACLLVRYGLQLEAVREQMAAGTWLCPHCYEEDHPGEDWICNSSICMTRRGLKPTGIAIFEAQQQGFASVAHHLQAQLASRKGGKAAMTAKPASDGALAVCKQAKQIPDAVGGSSCRETEGPDAAAASVTVQTYGLTSQATYCREQGSPANDEVPSEKKKEQSSQKTCGDRANAEGGVGHSQSDSSKTEVLVLDGQSVKVGSPSTGTNSDRGAYGSSIDTGTVLQNKLEGVQGNAVPAIPDTGKGNKLPGKASCIENRGLATMELKSARRRGLEHCTMEGTDVGSKAMTGPAAAAKNTILGYAVSLRRSGRHT